jgi:CRISPR-associated endonuclease Csn1
MKGVKMKNYRLGIDLGATSLGWSLFELDNNNEPVKLMRVGVRIFPDGRKAAGKWSKKEPLNVTRRTARGIRRNRDRYLQRRNDLMKYLIENNLMPKDISERKELEHLDPYYLRAKGLDEQLTLFEFGRAIFHLNQRRGFKSNRKFDSADKETSIMKMAIKELAEKLEETDSRTLGEYLYNLNKDLPKKEIVHSKPRRVKKGDKSYNLFPDRAMYLDEFEQLWEKQHEFHSELTNEIKTNIKNIIFYQRDLKPQEKGSCQFEEGEFRCSFAYVTAQKFRIFQELNNLELLDFNKKNHKLTDEQRAIILHTLLTQKTATFKSLRRKLGKDFANNFTFNLESEKRKDLKGDETSAIMRKDNYFGDKWDELADTEKDEIVTKILNEENDKEVETNLVNWLCDKYSLSEENAQNIANASLSKKISNLSGKAIRKLLPFLQDGFIYSDACEKAGYKLTDEAPEKPKFYKGNLPYYGELFEKDALFGDKEKYNSENEPEKYYGKIPNVTVHIALNQLRKFINELSKTYGAPKQIVLELARELKLGRSKVAEIEKIQAKNRKYNEKIAVELEKISVENNYANRTKYKLWEELADDPTKRCCPFSGIQIPIHKLFTHEFQIEHILPKSKTFNDRMVNKTIAHRKANQDKGERSPFEAFGHNPTGYNYNEILLRAEQLPFAKRRRFFPDAMKNYEDEGEVLSRMLTDTQYMSRIARKYMAFVCGKNNVWSIPGQLTAKLRSKWGLNELLSEDSSKNRADHRHHAVDAFVVACTSRSTMQKVARAIGNSRDKFIDKMPPPFKQFKHKEMKQLLDDMVISFKPDHGNAKKAITEHKTVGQLHKETAYGLVSKDEEKGKIILSVRKELVSLESIKKIKEITDPRIRATLLQLTEGKTGKEITGIISEFSKETGIKRVKTQIEKSLNSVVRIEDNKGNYKYYELRNNYCADIYCPDKGKKAGKWQIEIIPMFYAHQTNFIPDWQKANPTAKKIMRLYINDTVAYEENGETVIRRVKKMNIDGRLFFIDHKIAKSDKDPNATSVKQLQEKDGRKVGVDILGRVSDPKRAK